MYTKSIAVLIFSVALPIVSIANAFQDPFPQPRAEQSKKAVPIFQERSSSNRLSSSSLFESPRYLKLNEQRKTDDAISQAARSLRQAQSSDERAEAKGKLEALLGDDYDDRLKGYDEYLDQLEEKLAEMRAKLKKRREAKEEMIQLRIKVLESEADDLGWPERMSGRFTPSLKTSKSGTTFFDRGGK